MSGPVGSPLQLEVSDPDEAKTKSGSLSTSLPAVTLKTYEPTASG